MGLSKFAGKQRDSSSLQGIKGTLKVYRELKGLSKFAGELKGLESLQRFKGTPPASRLVLGV